MDSSCNQIQVDQVTVNPEQPWLDERGFKLTDEQLKLVSRTWDQATWDAYLDWYESPLAETLVEPYIYENQLEKMTGHIFAYAQEHADDDLRKRIAEVLSTLSPRQQQIIELIFWSGQSTRNVAETLRLSQSTVNTLKKRALKRIAAALKGVSLTSHTVGGIKFFFPEMGKAHAKEVLGLAPGDIPKAG